MTMWYVFVECIMCFCWTPLEPNVFEFHIVYVCVSLVGYFKVPSNRAKTLFKNKITHNKIYERKSGVFVVVWYLVFRFCGQFTRAMSEWRVRLFQCVSVADYHTNLNNNTLIMEPKIFYILGFWCTKIDRVWEPSSGHIERILGPTFQLAPTM